MLSSEGSAAITFLNAPPLFVIVLFVLGTAAFLFFSYRYFSVPASWRLRGLLAALRMGLILLVFWMLMDPYHGKPNASEWLGVLVDTSKSMAIEDAPEQSRLAEVQNYFQKDRVWNELQKDKIRQFSAFDSELQEVTSLKTLKPQGDSSRLLTSMQEISRLYQDDTHLLGWIVFTDGAVTEKREAERSLLDNPSFPWIVVAAGAQGEIPNVHLEAPIFPDPVFVGDEVTVRIPWTSNYPAGKKTKLKLSINGKAVLEKTVAVGAREHQEKWVPEAAGDYFFEISLEPLEGEGSLIDNAVRGAMRVHARDIQVFYAESFYKDINYFKEALEEDPSFYVSFVSSLIGFSRKNQVPFIKDDIHGLPRTREDMMAFDAVILSDVKKELLTQEQMEWIRDLVEKEGGAFIMIGGFDSFGDGGYVGSPIESLLPVEISEEHKQKTFLKARGGNETPFRPIIPDPAMHHPVLQLGDSPEENAALWKTVPLLGGYNYVGRPKSGAEVLLQHASDTSVFGPRVTLAVQSFGAGKTLAFTSDVTPNWGLAFQEWREEKKGWLYAKFWRNTLKWVTENKLRRKISQVVLVQEPALADSESPVTWKVRLARNIAASAHAALKLEVLNPDKKVLDSELFEDFSSSEMSWTLPVLEPGDYHLRAVISLRGKTVFELEKPFVVHSPRVESLNLAVRHDILEQLAAETRGVYLPFGRMRDLPKAIGHLRKALLHKRSVPFWNQPFIYTLILGILFLDWFLRKKRGLE